MYTLWAAVCVVFTATYKEWISHGEGVVILLLVTTILILIANSRDTKHELEVAAAELKVETTAVSAELSGKVAQVHDLVNHASDLQDARINQLIEVIQTHGIAVPPPDEKEP